MSSLVVFFCYWKHFLNRPQYKRKLFTLKYYKCDKDQNILDKT